MRTIQAVFILLTSFNCLAQQGENHTINAIAIENYVTVDGILNEEEWRDATPVTKFQLNFPSDTAKASSATIVRVLYNSSFLYISAELHNAANRKPTVSSLKRDFPFIENDAFAVILNPFNDHSTGYGFYISALGVQREEQIFNGNMVDASWDIKWLSEVKSANDGWIVEMAIPLADIRFSQKIDAIGINFIRNDIGKNEISSWFPTPRNFTFPNLTFEGTLAWGKIPKPKAHTVHLLPSFTSNAYQVSQNAFHFKEKPSLDAKIALTTSLNLDLTLNPDFSQAEVDQAQVNLTQYELSFPEKRFFFIENSDLFSEFGVSKVGTTTLRPFYSRRIGLTYNENTGQFEQASIIAGARINGKLTKDLRIGLMSIQTASSSSSFENKVTHYPSQNYSVVAVQQKVFSSSNIGFIFTNRQAFGSDSSSKFGWNNKNYNRLAGIDYNLISKDGKWTGKLYEHVMFDEEHTSSGEGGWLNYNSKKLIAWAGITRSGKNFSPAIGFIPRTNFTNLYTEWDYLIYPKSKIINNWGPIIHYSVYQDSAFRKTDYLYKLGGVINFKDTGLLYLLLLGYYTKLLTPFNPSLNEGKLLAAGTDYYYKNIAFYYLSDARKNVFGELYLQAGKYFNGNFSQFSGYLSTKIQPFGTLGVVYNLNFIRLPEPYSDNNIYAIGPKADISFSRKFFFNANVQYTSLNKNLNYFFRIQYRFKPLSDIFMIYGNNQNTTTWQRKDQSLIVKLTYYL
ncbi:hypothetical protein GS399_01265 [Pedobacter sp. HMF7647]|uniref:Hydrolase n=1 Tax=Hufsiella arboris TaxID=2695275 RepID=A0A7K1Y4T3_9SPHI|nr:DUF5916 domain-containing protein [Hufsiella arboris]MXV49586.1 hypothetical protein [Hufsiella arboris]